MLPHRDLAITRLVLAPRRPLRAMLRSPRLDLLVLSDGRSVFSDAYSADTPCLSDPVLEPTRNTGTTGFGSENSGITPERRPLPLYDGTCRWVTSYKFERVAWRMHEPVHGKFFPFCFFRLLLITYEALKPLVLTLASTPCSKISATPSRDLTNYCEPRDL